MHFSLDTLRMVLYPPAGDPKTSRTGVRRMKIGITQTFPQWVKIIYNPPFIRYQNFEEEHRKVAFELMTKHGFQPNRLMNIWLPFLVLACKALKPDGRVGMVIPAELFQVDYAAEARLFLSNYFESLTLVTFKKLVFDDIQQEVILLLGE